MVALSSVRVLDHTSGCTYLAHALGLVVYTATMRRLRDEGTPSYVVELLSLAGSCKEPSVILIQPACYMQ